MGHRQQAPLLWKVAINCKVCILLRQSCCQAINKDWNRSRPLQVESGALFWDVNHSGLYWPSLPGTPWIVRYVVCLIPRPSLWLACCVAVVCRDEAIMSMATSAVKYCGWCLQVVTTVIVSLVVEAFTFRLALGNEEAKRRRVCKRDHERNCKCYQGKKKELRSMCIHLQLIDRWTGVNIQHNTLYMLLQWLASVGKDKCVGS